jgi:hypothetical protein
MRDFSISAYAQLLDVVRARGYRTLPFCEVMRRGFADGEPSVVLRHDVDRLPWNSVRTAELEARRGMAGTYYFRVVPEAWDEEAIRAIADMGHECGYHYEDMDFARGDPDRAYLLFQRHLGRLRELVPIEMICMHGSPRSRWDNRDLWRRFDYRKHQILGEPYLDVNFHEVFYLTDTGRGWNRRGASLRDKVATTFDIEIRDTAHLCRLIRDGKLPGRMMITLHPQRWNSSLGPWLGELVGQNLKNIVKTLLVRTRGEAPCGAIRP